MKTDKYFPTIGIETHVQLKTKTKLFAAVSNDARNAAPNSLISHICVGMPGALPVLNREAINICVRAAFALGTQPQKFSKFERKHYFYPDLPKGYQITQYEDPIITGGRVDIIVEGQHKNIGIERANLEEDAGKNTHPAGADYSLVDLNRAGTPLLEIVSQPDIHSPTEAKAYVRELYLLMKYADVTDGDLYHGHMRFDLNVSVSPDPYKLGTRSEVKNLNSFRSVEAAVAYEIKRQIEVLEKGGKVVQETRGWDEAKQKTFAQRTKEEAEDYRYMPEPDMPPIELDDSYSEKIKDSMPRLPDEWRKILNKLSISSQSIETLIEAEAEHPDITFLMFVEEVIDEEKAANWLINTMVNIEIPLLRKLGSSLVPKSARWALVYEPVYKLLEENQISSTSAKKLITELLKMKTLPQDIKKYASEHEFLQISDESAMEKVVAEVIAENPKVAADIKAGKTKVIGFLVGQVMAKSKGQANPQLAQKLIKKQLGV